MWTRRCQDVVPPSHGVLSTTCVIAAHTFLKEPGTARETTLKLAGPT
jgi:hypothetical protein